MPADALGQAVAGAPTRVGWFGKLPGSGDFLARRIATENRQRLDEWLGGALLDSREAMGDAWLEAYLTAPVWRFAWQDPTGGGWVAGLLIPSVDRAGRYFPFAALAEFAGAPDGTWLGQADAFLSRVEPDVLDALEHGDADALDHRLLAHQRSVQRAPAPPSIASAGLIAEAWPVTQWWTEGSDRRGPAFLRFEGMPPAATYAAFLRDPDPDADLAALWSESGAADADDNGPLDAEWRVGAMHVHALTGPERPGKPTVAHAEASLGTGAEGAGDAVVVGCLEPYRGERRARLARFVAKAVGAAPSPDEMLRCSRFVLSRELGDGAPAALRVNGDGTVWLSGPLVAHRAWGANESVPVAPGAVATLLPDAGERLIVAAPALAPVVAGTLDAVAGLPPREAAQRLRDEALIAGVGMSALVLIDRALDPAA